MSARSASNSTRRRVSAALAAWLSVLPAHAVPTPPGATLLAVRINGEAVGDFVPLLFDGTRYYARGADLAAWRLTPSGVSRVDSNVRYYLVPGDVRLDATTQTLIVDVSAATFSPQRVDLQRTPAPAQTASVTPGLALDYDLNLESGDGRPRAAALLELGAFGVPGVPGTFSQRMVARNSVGEARLLRLDTQWRIERPAELATWTLGDSITCVGELGTPTRFAGVQYATDFGLRPDLVTWPLPSLAGSAAVPTAVDLLVNGKSAAATQVGSGPFQLDNPPLASGAGNVTVVQQDVLGRSTAVTVPYYVSPRLLNPRLSDYCVEGGVLRRNYGVTSADYGDAFTAVGGRFGITPTLTLLGRLESSLVSGLYLGANWLAGGAGIVTAQVAGSRAETGSGGYGQLRFERQASSVSVAGGVEAATRDYRRLSGDPLPAWRASVAGGVRLGRASVSVAGAWQRDRDQAASTRIASVSVASQLAGGWYGQLSAQNNDGETLVFATLTRSLDALGSLALSSQTGAGGTLTTIQAQQTEPLAGGFGWRTYASTGRSERQQAGVSWLGQGGRFSIEAANDTTQDSRAVRLGGRGGIVWLGGMPGLTRGLGEGALARVSVPGLAGVPVLHQHRVVAVTDANGDAWVPNLLPYQDNALEIDPLSLPLSMRLDREALVVRPPSRSAVRVVFGVEDSRAALVELVDEAGQPLPPGARVRLAGRGGEGAAEAPVGLRGEVYLERLASHNRADVRWGPRRCTVEFDRPSGTDPQPRVGPLVCRAVL